MDHVEEGMKVKWAIQRQVWSRGQKSDGSDNSWGKQEQVHTFYTIHKLRRTNNFMLEAF